MILALEVLVDLANFVSQELLLFNIAFNLLKTIFLYYSNSVREKDLNKYSSGFSNISLVIIVNLR